MAGLCQASADRDWHFDGGASCVILVVTLWGARALTLFGAEDKKNTWEASQEEHDIENWPGSVYLSCLCPVEHQVRYPCAMTRKLGEEGATELPGLGRVGVSIVFRADLFSHSRASAGGNALPNPIGVFNAFQESFDWLAKERQLRLPSMEEVLRSSANFPLQ